MYACMFFLELSFQLRDPLKEEDESSGAIQVRIGVGHQRILASEISLVLTPKTAPVEYLPKPLGAKSVWQVLRKI